MASALDLLRSFGEHGKPYFGFSDLRKGNHEILQFKLVKNVHYNKKNEKSLKRVILVELKDQVLFLPEYFAQKFKDNPKKIDELNRDGVKKFLFFGGSRKNR